VIFRSVNPATGETFSTYEETSSAEITRAASSARAAFLKWRDSPFSERRTVLKALAAGLKANRTRYARLITAEMGKPIRQAEAEIDKCAACCEFYAEHGEKMLKDEIVAAANTGRSFVSFRPLGVVLAIMPWNFPFWQAFRFLAPALMAGNGALLKHAGNVCGSALAIEDVVKRADAPEGLFRALLIPAEKAATLIADPNIAAVTLTGSTDAGRAVAAAAGKNLKKCVLELGGSDPYVVLNDADLELAATVCVQSRTLNTGQSCIAAKRFVVDDAVYDAFEQLFVEKMRALKTGDPSDPDNAMGPLARPDLRDELHAQVTSSVAKGATLKLGGFVPEGPGAFYPATVLADVKPGMPAYDEELFGPAAALIRAKDESDAIRIANDTEFGLGACVFTRDPNKGERLAKYGIDAGSVFVNALVKSDPRLPFGGIKNSGYGRELSAFGLREFTNIKTIIVG
jgi:succinate-semialdehyde dehydrogenase/glutarate-semialdehyde dehydrogenase